jgi:hypothetical protein
MKKLPIGLSDFKELIEEEYYYIDKTNLISEVIDNSAKIVLLPRPRRFGKTLNLSMTKYFFDVEEDNETLFKGLNISKNQEAMAHCGKYPIIYITFKDIKERNFQSSFKKIKQLIEKEISRHESKIEPILDRLNSADVRHYKRLVLGEASDTYYGNSFKLLSKLLTTA